LAVGKAAQSKSHGTRCIMAWERRKETTQRYYYRHARNFAGRPIKLYVGRGADAGRLAEADEAARRERTAASDLWLQRWAQIELASLPLDEYCNLVNLLLKVTLLTSGLHKHGGTWRRRAFKWPTNFK